MNTAQPCWATKSQSNSRRMACLGIRLGKLKLYSWQRLAFGQAGVVNAPFQGPLPADGDFFADQGGQHVAAWKCRCGPPRRAPPGYSSAMRWSFNSARSRKQFFVAWRGHAGVPGSGGVLVVGIAAEPVVAGRIGLFQVNVFDQFAAFGLQGRGRGEFAAAALLQQQRLHVGRVVGLVLEGLADGGQHVLAAVKPHQPQEPPQVDGGLDRHREQFQVELAGRGPEGVELLFALAGLATTTQFQGRQAVLRMDEQLALLVTAWCASLPGPGR